MAGAGYKLFNTGDVLTAQQVNEYLMQQTVMVFADASARTTALSGVLAEGMLSYLKSTDATEVYNGSAWVGLAADQTPLTTKGDLFTYTTADARLASSNVNGDVLTVDTSTASGLKWATPAPSGLAFISRTSFTSASSVTVDDLFSDTYEHYLIRIQMKNVTSAGIPRLRARYGSTTESGSVYWSYGVLRDTSDATVGFAAPETTSWRLDNSLSTANLSSYSMNLWRGNGSGVLVFDGTLHSRNLVAGGAFGGWCNASQTWTGLYLFPESNTMTGTITVYGMAKS